MKPVSHIIISFSLGAAVWFFAKSLYAAMVCFLSGFLLDIDHIIEYIVHYGWKDFTFKKCYQACEQVFKKEGEYQFKKLHLIFHSAEIALLFWLITSYTKNIYLFAGVLGYSVHLILDSIGNQLYPYSYFIVWRAINRFSPDRLFRKRITQKK